MIQSITLGPDNLSSWPIVYKRTEFMFTDYDSWMVNLYDGDNPDGPDHDYYRSLASPHEVQRILDLGCGTGILTVTLANHAQEVVGVDPSPAMISYARQRPGANDVTWIEGDSSSLSEGSFDLMVMTGNVAQHIPDPYWDNTLKDLRKLASEGCMLAFESRNPSTRAWEKWAAEEPTTRDTIYGPLSEWSKTVELDEGQVQLRSFSKFGSENELVEESVLLTFRDAQLLTEQLAAAGFETSAIWGDWDRTPFDGSQGVMIFEARAV